MNELRNFDEIFRKNVTYGILKVTHTHTQTLTHTHTHTHEETAFNLLFRK